MAKKLTTAQAGAQAERDAMIAIARRLRNAVAKDPMQNPVEVLDRLLKKYAGRKQRFDRKVGGLGK